VAESSQPSNSSRVERIALNEAWCRDLNERKAEWMKGGDLAAGFRCECWQAECDERIGLSGTEWQEVRSRPNRFAVVPGHIASEHESVIAEYPHFWMIEKQGEAGEVAEELA
jgi:hypothetical protein